MLKITHLSLRFQEDWYLHISAQHNQNKISQSYREPGHSMRKSYKFKIVNLRGFIKCLRKLESDEEHYKQILSLRKPILHLIQVRVKWLNILTEKYLWTRMGMLIKSQRRNEHFWKHFSSFLHVFTTFIFSLLFNVLLCNTRYNFHLRETTSITTKRKEGVEKSHKKSARRRSVKQELRHRASR